MSAGLAAAGGLGLRPRGGAVPPRPGGTGARRPFSKRDRPRPFRKAAPSRSHLRQSPSPALRMLFSPRAQQARVSQELKKAARRTVSISE